jgi:hypothetical protein
MPLPGTPWRDAPPGDVDPATVREVDRLSQRGALYGHWQKQRDHATRLAATAKAYPRPGRSRTILPLASTAEGRGPGVRVEAEDREAGVLGPELGGQAQ